MRTPPAGQAVASLPRPRRGCRSSCSRPASWRSPPGTPGPRASSPARRGRTSCSSPSTRCGADALGSYGQPRPTSPLLDRLAREGVRFETAHAHNTVTLPSHANILSGRYPFEHGVRDNAGFRFPRDTETLATLLKARGYRTGAFVSAFVLDSRFGLDRGFDTYEDAFGDAAEAGPFRVPERAGPQTVRLAREWIARQDGPWLAWVHLYDPHAPYRPPAAFASAFRGRPVPGRGGGGRRRPAAAPRAPPRRGPLGAHGRGRDLRPRRVARRARRGDPRPLRLRGDAARAPPPPRAPAPPAPRGARARAPRRRAADRPRRARLSPPLRGCRAGASSAWPGAAARRPARATSRPWPGCSAAAGRRSTASCATGRSTSTCRCPSSTTSPGTPASRRTSWRGRPWSASASSRPSAAFRAGDPGPRRAEEDAETRERLRALGYVADVAAPPRERYTESDDPKRLVHLDRLMEADARPAPGGGRRGGARHGARGRAPAAGHDRRPPAGGAPRAEGRTARARGRGPRAGDRRQSRGRVGGGAARLVPGRGGPGARGGACCSSPTPRGRTRRSTCSPRAPPPSRGWGARAKRRPRSRGRARPIPGTRPPSSSSPPSTSRRGRRTRPAPASRRPSGSTRESRSRTTSSASSRWRAASAARRSPASGRPWRSIPPRPTRCSTSGGCSRRPAARRRPARCSRAS